MLFAALVDLVLITQIVPHENWAISTFVLGL